LAFVVSVTIVYIIVAVPTLFYSQERIWMLLLFILLSSSAMISFIIVYAGRYLRSMRTDEYVVTAVMAAIFSTEVFWGMLLPGVLYEIPFISPFVIMLSSYLPKAIIYGIVMGYSYKPFISTLFFTIWGIASEIIYPNPAWAPYYVAWGALLDIFVIIGCSNESEVRRRSISLLGFLFGYAGWGFTKAYEIVLWGNWHPLRLIIIAMILNGMVTCVGVQVGYKIGQKARSVVP